MGLFWRASLVAYSLLAVVLVACARTGDTEPQAQKAMVVTTIYPLQFFASEIGGDSVQVINLVPPGVEAHDWEPAPQDIARIDKARLFVYNGAGFEPWAERVLANTKSSGLLVVNTSRGILAGEGSQEVQQGLNPHFWLDPVLGQYQAQLIAEALIRTDPANDAAYQTRYLELQAKLKALDAAFQKGLSTCQRRVIITSHDFFAYVARRYNLEAIPIAGLSPDQEPSPTNMADLARLARTLDVKYIFFETLVSPALAQVLAREVGAQTLVFNPLEGLTQEELSDGLNYFSVMETNLYNLRLAMGCGIP